MIRRLAMTAGGRMMVLVLVATFARAVTFGSPKIDSDEQFYLVVARAMWAGAWPYVDIWDRKPVGLFLLYMPAAALPLPLALWAYQAMALGAAVATAWMIGQLARSAGWHAGALLAGVAYLLWINFAEGQGGQAPILYNPMVAGAALLIGGGRKIEIRRASAAMLLLGLAIQVKTSVVFEGVFFGLWIAGRHLQTHRRPLATLGYAATLAGTALLPTFAVMGVFAAAGRFDAFWFANVVSIFGRHADPWPELLGNLGGVILILSPLVALAGLTFADARRTGIGEGGAFLFGWLAAALFGLAVFGTWFEHYALPAMVPACVCAAGAIGHRARLRRWAVPTLVAVAFAGQVVLALKRASRGTPAQFAAVAAAIGRGPGCLWVYSGDPMLYAATERCTVSRFVFPSHLVRMRENGAIGVDQAVEVRRVLARGPAVIAMRQTYRGERLAIRAIVLAAVTQRYRETAALPLGRRTIRIYKRR